MFMNTTRDDGIRGLLADVRRYSVAPCVLFGSPGALKQICAFLGFRNACSDGKVYITPTKIDRLTALGLAAPLAGAAAGWTTVRS
jgi:hypothetical protein